MKMPVRPVTVTGKTNNMQPNTDPAYLKSQGLSPTTVKRFLEKIEIDPVTGCWPWKAMTHQGYGIMARGFNLCKPIKAARVAYIIYKEPIPEGQSIRHKCPHGPNKLCCNPEHLEVGTHAENMADEKGDLWYKKHPKENWYMKEGEKSPFSKVTLEQAREIRRLRAEGMKQIPLAKMFHVSQATIWNILHNITLPEKDAEP